MDVVLITLKSALFFLGPISAIEMSSPSIDVPVMRPTVRITWVFSMFNLL
ncbi:MAG: hypothetical protein CM1200mP10_32690 [Candidatus Neomarinimicrobiota bacterium]|nr:MAG: hypothetical protein CM1200mP10_32690 [Candidatus Neomarinimicrobiota bacterium]